MARVELPWVDDDSVTIAIPSEKHPDGKDYTFAAPDIDTGLQLSAIAQLGVKAGSGGELTEADLAKVDLDDDAETDLYRQVMGATYDELVADRVSWTRLQRVGRYLFIRHGLGEDAAAQAVQASPGGSRPPANRAQRRAASKTAPAKTSAPKGSRGSSKPRPSKG